MKVDFGIDIGVEFLDFECVAFLDAVLFTACFDYCVGHMRMGNVGKRVEKSLSACGAGAESTMKRHSLQGFFAPV